MRIRKELTLASNKPSIHTVLWKDIQIRALDIRCGEEYVDAKGELFVFVLYAGDDEDHPSISGAGESPGSRRWNAAEAWL